MKLISSATKSPKKAPIFDMSEHTLHTDINVGGKPSVTCLSSSDSENQNISACNEEAEPMQSYQLQDCQYTRSR